MTGNSSESAPRPPPPVDRPEAGRGAETQRARTWTVAELLQWTVDRFSQVGIEGARVDAEHLLAQALGCSRMELYVQHDRPITSDERAPFRDMVTRRIAREPVAYILGRRGFHALDLELCVNAHVLIPRPETEHLVDWLLEELEPRPAPPMTVLDVGTGSGAIALAVKRARPDVTVVGMDLSAEAVSVARENANRSGLEVEFVVGDLRNPLAAIVEARPPVAAVAANLPYIPTAELSGLAPEVADFEPQLALDGGADGLDSIRALIENLKAGAFAGVPLYLEVGAGQADAVTRVLEDAGYTGLATRRDFSGVARVVLGHVPIAKNWPRTPETS